MQNSALYRQAVVLPLDVEAEECLRTNDVDPCMRVRALAIPNYEVFADLWRLKFFAAINARCAAIIDEYEEEWIDATAVTKVLAVIDSVAGTAREAATLAFLGKLRALVVEAQAMSRPLLFVL